MAEKTTMKKVGILYHSQNEPAHVLAEKLKTLLVVYDASAWLCSAWDEDNAVNQLDNTELIITIGGDGTILRAAQVALKNRIPITGINMGNLGFMTELKAGEAEEILAEILEGKGWIDERAMLETTIIGEQPKAKYFALNDVALARGIDVRMVSIEVGVNNEYFTTYRADGVVISTATGSTGYSLSAGGPILYPGSRDLLLTPLLSHFSLRHSMVLSPDTTIKLKIRTPVPAALSIDGHTSRKIEDGTEIVIKRSKYITRFLRIHPPEHFYGALEQKLKGKQINETRKS